MGFDYFGEERTVDTHVRRLRKKLEKILLRRIVGWVIVWRNKVNKLGKSYFSAFL